ncbi:ethanolamine ammonia-lyase subunit EutC [Sutcliffiella rhizosphaerae]|uniref:Ethanolamine ammonia-lyase small subunit n=1 Tax=Sutcliffiella rhizosphaerae TaxID=2880967 RepID=A0ABN8AA66_9BACI|nr:ethanolamine ammonia-lyase subunit EutC [Sutcliffiella rhizosphaerae]CAG9620317.1 Ethanolamine ammonia-lyase light chain [Sutcliffiella rhizosphaerae]
MDIQAIVEMVMKELEKNDTKIVETTPSKKHQVNEVIYKTEKIVTVDDAIKKEDIEKAQAITPARIGIGRTGTRMKTKNYLDFRIDHAAAQDAVFKDVSKEFIKTMSLPVLQSRAESMEQYLMNLDSGRRLSAHSIEWAQKNLRQKQQVQVIISDGLSSTGVEATIPDLLPALLQGLKVKNISVGEPVFIQKSRVWIQDEIASITDCEIVISLIGERPGLATSKSVSAYFIYRPNEKSVEADRTVISNIHEGGIPPVEAGAYLADLLEQSLHYKASGVKLARIKGE